MNANFAPSGNGAGGFGAGARADRYDPATDVWERLADLPVETNHPGITVLEDRVIVAGGYAMDGASAPIAPAQPGA